MPVQLMMGKQSARATAVTPTYSVPITSDSIPTEVPVVIASDRRNANNLNNLPRKGAIGVEYQIAGELDPISVMPLLASMFPKYTFSDNTPVAGAKTHIFKPATLAAEYTAIHTTGWTQEFYNAITGNSYTSVGSSLTSFNLSMPENSMIPWTADVMARSVTEGSSGETFNPPDGALTLWDYTAALSAGGIGSEVAIPIYDLTVNCALPATYRHARGSGASLYSTRLKANRNGLSISGTFKVSREDSQRTAVKSDHDNFTESSVIVTYTSDQLVTGATYYSVSLALQEVIYTRLTRAEENNEDMEVYEFMAGFGNDSDNIIWTVVNNQGTMGL